MNTIAFTEVPLSARPASNVWQVIIEQATRGQATIVQDGARYAVQFPDEAEPLPFEYLAYRKDIGLYDTRQFPDLSEE